VPERTAASQPQAEPPPTSSSTPVDSILAKRDYSWTSNRVTGVNHDSFIACGGFAEVHKVPLLPYSYFFN
jgi:hypothetical protein